MNITTLTLCLPEITSVQVMQHAGTRGGCRRVDPSLDIQPGEEVRIGDRSGQGLDGSCVADALVRPILVAEDLVLVQRVQQMPLVRAENLCHQAIACAEYPSAQVRGWRPCRCHELHPPG
jgi:hypothetical protein